MRENPVWRRGLPTAGGITYAVVFFLFLQYERPGLGIAHGYYIAVILIALAAGPRTGVAAGALATGLYGLGVWLNPHVPVAELPTVATAIRAVTYISVGLTVGCYAAANRRLAARMLALMDELRVLAERDKITGLANMRAFEGLISRRIENGRPFTLLLGHLDGLERLDESGYDEGNDLLRSFAMALGRHLGPESDIARIGKETFAVLSAVPRGARPRESAGQLEALLLAEGHRVSVGWASFPTESHSALSLYRAADERLYARRLLRETPEAPLRLANQ